MTITELIERVKAEKPNSFSDSHLYIFLNSIEAEVAEQLGRTHKAYTTSDASKKLLAPSPYDRLYVSWMKAQIDYAQEEYDSYENNQAQHVADFQDFVDAITRNGMITSSVPPRFVNVL